ncbi:hypothetical protein C8R45DRAFT_1138813 [Mycena sanguinolenta]|nr:hypothetical protein C8R45DRAFT_1138813 [Mycena sanguinolenta]
MALWNFTIEDTSPFLTYTPYADGSNCGLTNGWIPWYQKSGFLAKNGDPGVGESYHITSRNGASVSLKFYGSDIYLYGTTNSSYEITLDDVVSPYGPPTSDLLFSSGSIAVGTHLVTLNATPSNVEQHLAFDRAIISSRQVGHFFIRDATPTEAFYDNTDTARLTYTGAWSTPSAPGIPNTSVEHPWHETDNSASVSMQIGQGAVAVSLWGMTNWGNWIYSVSLDGSTNSYNGSTFFQVPDALLFYESGLDPANNHTISLTNVSPGMNLALNSIRVYTVDIAASTAGMDSTLSPTTHVTSPTAGRSSVNVGITAGATVGAALLLAFAGALLWRCLRRRAAVANEVTQVERYSYVPSGSGTQPKFPAAAFRGVHISKTSPSNSIPLAGDLSGQLSPVRNRRPTPLSSPTTPPTATSVTTDTSPTTFPMAMTVANVDLDQLVELIAQRIDPTGGQRFLDNDADTAPPQYRG